MPTKISAEQHRPEDDPKPGTPGTGQDTCPVCQGTGMLIDAATGKATDQPCARCDGSGVITQGIG